MPQMISSRLGRRQTDRKFLRKPNLNEISRLIPLFLHTDTLVPIEKTSLELHPFWNPSGDSSLLQNYDMSKHIKVNNII
jgi:hypothetical protein